MALKHPRRNTVFTRPANGGLITPGQFRALRSRLKEEFGLAVDTLEVQASSLTWTSITKLPEPVGGYFVSLEINLEKAPPKFL